MPEEKLNTAAADAALAESAAAAASANGRAADQRIAELELQLREVGERALRAQAELENFRKRAQRELSEERRYALVPLVRDLLPVVDNLERAIEASQARNASEGFAAGQASDGLSSLLEGVKMVANQFQNILSQHQCRRIETVGAPFDPNQHEAIAQEPSEQYPAGTVTRAAQSGYTLHDRVIRPAQVFVSTGPGETQSTK